MPQIYLASKSPRRREILASLGLTDIALLPAGDTRLTAYAGDEVQGLHELPQDYVVRTAREKALQALAKISAQQLPAAPVLSADTVVISQGRVLGKPVNLEEELEFLGQLSGSTHEVRTAVWVGTTPENLQHRVSISRVTFRPLNEVEMRAYAATSEPYDKAGGYAVQGMAALFISRIEGSYSGIMGLPVFETGILLRPYQLLPF